MYFCRQYSMGVIQMVLPQLIISIKNRIIESIYQIKYRMNLKMKFLLGILKMPQMEYCLVSGNCRYKNSSCLL